MQCEEHRATEIHDELKAIGRVPRLLSALLIVALTAVYVAIGATREYSPFDLLFIAFPATLFVLSLRVRATFEEKTLTVRSYLRTYEIRLDDHIVTFADVPYQGWWSGYAPLYLFGPLGLWQVDIVYVRSGRPTSLPVTMCTRRRCQRIVESLNDMLPDGPVWPDLAG